MPEVGDGPDAWLTVVTLNTRVLFGDKQLLRGRRGYRSDHVGLYARLLRA